MKTTIRLRAPREVRWEKSRRAERRGDYAKALEIHRTILAEDDASYAACLRAGWLCYRLGNYGESLRFYQRARELTQDAWPVYGIMNCLVELGDTETLAKVSESAFGAGCAAPRSTAA